MRLSRLLPARLRRQPDAGSARAADRPPRAADAPEGDGQEQPDQGFLHVVATRHGIGVFDELWFEYRQLLLEHLTFASLKAQTSQDFLWLIGIDRDMPESARRRLDRMIVGRPHIQLLELELKRDFKGSVAKWVTKEAAARNVGWVLTTRLDDDDALHRELLSRLQDEAQAVLAGDDPRRAAFAPVLGCNWVPSELAGHRAFHPSPSMGLTVMLPTSEPRSVYHWNHMRLQEQIAPSGAWIKCLDDDRMWWLYAHTNISDQHHEGSKRRTKAFSHSESFSLGESLLREYGVSAAGASLLQNASEPEPVDSTHYLTGRGADLEIEIVGIRKALHKRQYSDDAEAASMRERIAELHKERKRLHENLVQLAPKPKQQPPEDGL